MESMEQGISRKAGRTFGVETPIRSIGEDLNDLLPSLEHSVGYRFEFPLQVHGLRAAEFDRKVGPHL